MYNITQVTTIPASITASAVSSLSSTPASAPSIRQIETGPGPSNLNSEYKLAFLLLFILGGLFIAVMLSILIRRSCNSKRIGRSPKLLNNPIGNREWLVLNKLPKTDDLNYTVQNEYIPQLDDEMRLTVGQVIQVNSTSLDGWATAFDISTGIEKYIPLICLIPLKNSKLIIPKRVESVSIFSPNLHKKVKGPVISSILRNVAGNIRNSVGSFRNSGAGIFRYSTAGSVRNSVLTDNGQNP
jgi:hypothetical protein